MTLRNGLYSIHTDMTDGGHGHASGVIVLRDGKMAGGDSHFYYTGSYTAENGKWRGELITNEHTRSVGELPLFAAAVQAEEEQRDTMREKLQGLDIDALSPREALELLYELKREASA